VYSQSIQNLLKEYWNQMEPSRVLVSLSLLAKHKPDLINVQLRELIVSKVEESQSKFRYNTELKNTLFTLFEMLDGDQGKIYLNKQLNFLSIY